MVYRLILTGMVLSLSFNAAVFSTAETSASLTCASDWAPGPFPKDTLLTYTTTRETSGGYYTASLAKETNTAKGNVRKLDYSFYINRGEDSGNIQLVATRKTEITEFLFTTKAYGSEDKHLKAISHGKQEYGLSSDNFKDIRLMAVGEKYTIKSEQKADRSRKAVIKKWAKDDSDIFVTLMGCGENIYADNKYKTRTYKVEHNTLRAYGNKHNKMHQNTQLYTLDEDSGILLEQSTVNESGQVVSAWYLIEVKKKPSN